MERSAYYQSLPLDIKSRYDQKVKIIDDTDPYLLKFSAQDLLSLPSSFPEISMMDLVNYFILTHSFYTGQQMKAYKSLQAFKFYESGLVQNIYAKRANETAFVVVGKVKHSQRLREKPLEVWIIILSDGSISSGHCTCMAGLGEVCSHIAAIFFFLHARPQSMDEEACTSKLAMWPVPPVKNVEMSRIRDMDFTQNKKTRDTSNVPTMTKEEISKLLLQFNEIGISSAASRLVEPLASQMLQEQPTNLPPSLDSLFEGCYVGKTYEELLHLSKQILIIVSPEDVMAVEKATRGQSTSLTWFKQRVGRITASTFKAVCRTSIQKPSLSLIKGICYPQKVAFTSKQTTYGLKHEVEALDSYKKKQESHHQHLEVLRTGFFISTIHPELGASPDALVQCVCCGRGTVEVKCPYLLKDMTLEEFAEKRCTCLNMRENSVSLDKGHSYFYQIQCQMFITETKYCDFVVWSPKTLFVERISFDDNFFKTNLKKGLDFFHYVIKPELLGKYFTERAGLGTVTLWCSCKTLDDGTRAMIRCDNDDCNIGWYHFDCVGLDNVPERNWFCSNCL